MSYVTWKIEHTPFVNNIYVNDDTTELTRWFQPEFITNLGSSKDSFSFKLNNFNGNLDNFFNPRDKITIYRALNTTTITDNDILAVCAVNDVPESITSSGDMIQVKGYNFSETIAGALVFLDPLTSALTIPEAFQQGLNSINNYNSAFAVTWSTDNPTQTSASASFPTVGEKIFYRPFKYLIEKYSTNQYTTDGNYYWYINKNNELIWRKETDTIIDTFISSSDTDYIEYKIGKDTSDIKNFIIIKGGSDPKGKQITYYYQDPVSTAKHGFKYYYMISNKNYAQNINSSDMNEIGAAEEDGTLPSNVSGFSYPYTFSWMISAGETEATSDDDYVSKLRIYVKSLLLKDGKEFIDTNRNGKLKVDITVRAGSKSWGLGDVIQCTIPNTNINSTVTVARPLRIKEIAYGEITDRYSLEEDKGSI